MAKIINKWTVGITVAAVLGFAAWSYFQPEPQTSYITETVKRGDISQTVSATGEISPVADTVWLMSPRLTVSVM